MIEYTITKEKLQHIYDLHSADFGLSGNKNLEQLKLLADGIESHMDDVDTKLVLGQYRGQPARLYWSSRTNLVIVTSPLDAVIAAFKASPAQAVYIQQTGRLN